MSNGLINLFILKSNLQISKKDTFQYSSQALMESHAHMDYYNRILYQKFKPLFTTFEMIHLVAFIVYIYRYQKGKEKILLLPLAFFLLRFALHFLLLIDSDVGSSTYSIDSGLIMQKLRILLPIWLLFLLPSFWQNTSPSYQNTM